MARVGRRSDQKGKARTGKMQMSTMVPANIRFTHMGISNIFGRLDKNRGRNIGETLDDLCDGVCTVYDIDPIRVFEHDGCWWSMDNRRLWVFRQFHALGRCDEVPVKVTKREQMDNEKFDATTGKDVCVRGPVGGQWYEKAKACRRQEVKRQLSSENCGEKIQDECKPVVNLRRTAQSGQTAFSIQDDLTRPGVSQVDSNRRGSGYSATRESEHQSSVVDKSVFWSGALLGFLIACVLSWIYHRVFSSSVERL